VLTTPEEYPEWFAMREQADPGFERELLEGFAKLHRMKLEVVTVPSFDGIIGALIEDRGDLIRGIIDTPARRRKVAFTSSSRRARAQSGSSCCFGSGRKKLAAKPAMYTERPTTAAAAASLAAGAAPGMTFASVVVASAAEVPSMRPPTLAAKPSPVPRRWVG
jgi:hypothetical protein